MWCVMYSSREGWTCCTASIHYIDLNACVLKGLFHLQAEEIAIQLHNAQIETTVIIVATRNELCATG